MNFAITIQPDKELGVDLRELHGALESKQDFSTWAKARLDQFEEGSDFCSLHNSMEQSGRGGHNRIDYAVSIDCAKHIAMMEQTDRGRAVRAYFIECERKLLQPAMSEDALILQAMKTLTRRVEALEPDALFGRELKDTENLLSFTQVAKPLHMSAVALCKLLHEREVIFKQSGEWMPYAKYQDSGYFEIVAYTVDVRGESRVYHQLKVTARGRAFIHELCRKAA